MSWGIARLDTSVIQRNRAETNRNESRISLNKQKILVPGKQIPSKELNMADLDPVNMLQPWVSKITFIASCDTGAHIEAAGHQEH